MACNACAVRFSSRVLSKMAATVESVQNRMKQEAESFQAVQKSTLKHFLLCSLVHSFSLAFAGLNILAHILWLIVI